MEMEEIITSGQLELYVTGSLSQREAMKVEELLQQYPEVKKEVEAIEKSLIGITENKNIPIILDDPFVTADANRKESLREVVTEIAKQHQVILFTNVFDYSDWGNTIILPKKV